VHKKQIAYKLSPAGSAAMNTISQQGAEIAPLAYRLQGYRYNRVMLVPIADRLGQAVTGQITADQAFERITADIKDQLATAMQK
jgi:alpha-1,4-digalacturonate transport system substrate-binding protein